jgi:hypothetical protein
MRSFGVNSTKKDREHSSLWWKNLINTNMRECWSGNYTTYLLNYQTGKMTDHEEGSCEGQDQDLS